MKLNYGVFNRPGHTYNQPADASVRLIIREYLEFPNTLPVINAGYVLSAIVEALEFAAVAPTVADGYVVMERLGFSGSASSSGTTTEIVAEDMLFHEFIRFGIVSQVADTLNLSTTEELVHNVVVLVKEVLAFDSTLNTDAVITVALMEALALSDLADSGRGGTVVDTFELVSTITEQVKAMMVQSEILAIAESISEPQLWIYVPEIRENLQLDDTAQNAAFLYDIINEALEFGIRFSTGDGSFAGWALNTRTAAASKYTNYNFNSLHRVGNTVYAGGSDGLYKLEGAQDDGTDITPVLTTAMLNLSNGRQVRVPSVYLGMTSDAKLIVKTVTGEGIERWYESRTPVSGVETTRVILGRKPSARLWQFELTPRAPATAFELSRIELLPVQLTRRVPNGR